MNREVRMPSPVTVMRKKVHWKDLEDRNRFLGDEYDPVHILESMVAPSPSRDFWHLEVSKIWVELTQWRISHCPKATPTRFMTELRNWHLELQMLFDISRIFGCDMVQRITYLSEYYYGPPENKKIARGAEKEDASDWILKLPDIVLAKIFSFVGIEALSSLAPVCKKFKKVCKCNALWETFYDQHKQPSDDQHAKERNELEADAMEFTWKGIFLRDRIQDNIFEDRMRLGPAPQQSKSAMKRIPLAKPSIPLYF